MAKPSQLPEWDTTQVNSIVPDATHKEEGWLAPGGVPEKPPFQTFNYWQNEVYRWVQHLDEITTSVDSIADLRAITYTPVNGQVAQVLGYHTRGDGSGSCFVWDSGNLATEVTLDTNDKKYIAPNSDLTGESGAWVKQINVAFYYPLYSAADQGDPAVDETLASHIATIGADQATIVLRNNSGTATTTYTVTTNVTIPENITMKVEQGAIIDGNGQLTTDGELDAGVLTDVSEASSFVDRLKAYTSVHSLYARDDGAGNFAIGLHHNTNQVAEYRIGPNIDGLYKLQGGFVGPEIDDVAIVPTLNGTFITSAANSYTTTLNDTFTFSFYGTGFGFKHLSDDRGGVWQFKVDGVVVAVISTFASVATYDVNTEIVKGLIERNHTVVATFLGDDPDNAPSGGTSRGWLLYDYLSVGENTTVDLHSVNKLVIKAASAVDILHSASISDFAIFAVREDDTVSAGDWIPAHSPATGATRVITTKIYIDGVFVDNDPSIALPEAITAEEVQVYNKYTAFNSNDVAGTYPLWEGYLAYKISKDGLEVTHRIKMLGDVEVTAGYLSMLASNSDYVDSLILNRDEAITPLPQVNLTTYVNALSNSACFLNTSGGDIAIALDLNLHEAYRKVDKRIIPKESAFLVQRINEIVKMYWDFARGDVLPSGSVYRVSNKYFITGGLFSPWVI